MKKTAPYFSGRAPVWATAALSLLLPGAMFVYSTPFAPPSGVAPGTPPKDWTSEETAMREMLETGEYARLGDVRHLLVIVRHYLKNGNDANAERWIAYGAFQLNDPSMMLFYGDFLRGRGREEEARTLYRMALARGVAAGEKAEPFTLEVRSRLNSAGEEERK